jgi:hypothetical protein
MHVVLGVGEGVTVIAGRKLRAPKRVTKADEVRVRAHVDTARFTALPRDALGVEGIVGPDGEGSGGGGGSGGEEVEESDECEVHCGVLGRL